MVFMSELKVTRHYWERRSNVRLGITNPPPVMVDIHPTLACQNKCYFCISANSHVGGIERVNFDRKHTLDWSVLQGVIYDLLSMGVESIQLTGGGEPTLYPEFGELLEEISPHRRIHRCPSPAIGLITNGIKAGEWASDIVGGCKWVRVSLDASNPMMYKQIKGVDHFDDVLESIDKLVKMRTKGIRPRLGVAYILTPESLPGIVEVVKVLNKTGIDYLQFKDVVNRGLGFTADYQANIEKLMFEAKRIAKMPIYYTGHEGVRPRQVSGGRCDALDYVGVLGADGNVYGCCHLEYLPEASYGSIYSKTFPAIWSGRKRIPIEENRCWNCRFSGINRVIGQLRELDDTEFL